MGAALRQTALFFISFIAATAAGKPLISLG
jgi:hypothetical protein